MASIGSASFHTATGSPFLLQTYDEEYTRPGINGHGFHELGKRATEFTVNTFEDFTSASSAKSAYVGYAALVGTLVTYTDDHGNTYTNCQVRSVTLTQPIRRALNAVGGSNSGEYPVFATWTLLQAS